MTEISEAITILADKVGIGVDTLYQLNLSVQMIKAISDIVTVLSMLVMAGIAAIIIYRWDNSDQYTFDDILGKLVIFAICVVCIVIACIFLQFCIEGISLRLIAPQYMAMKDTISMIGSMI